MNSVNSQHKWYVLELNFLLWWKLSLDDPIEAKLEFSSDELRQLNQIEPEEIPYLYVMNPLYYGSLPIPSERRPTYCRHFNSKTLLVGARQLLIRSDDQSFTPMAPGWCYVFDIIWNVLRVLEFYSGQPITYYTKTSANGNISPYSIGGNPITQFSACSPSFIESDGICFNKPVHLYAVEFGNLSEQFAANVFYSPGCVLLSEAMQLLQMEQYMFAIIAAMTAIELFLVFELKKLCNADSKDDDLENLIAQKNKYREFKTFLSAATQNLLGYCLHNKHHELHKDLISNYKDARNGFMHNESFRLWGNHFFVGYRAEAEAILQRVVKFFNLFSIPVNFGRNFGELIRGLSKPKAGDNAYQKVTPQYNSGC